MSASLEFFAARDKLLAAHEDQGTLSDFRWPRLARFNWARDVFDTIAERRDRCALRVIDASGAETQLTFGALARRSLQVAAFLAAHGVRRGDRILIMLGNVVPLWEVMLAAIRMGAVVIPTTTLLQRDDLAERLKRGEVRAIVTEAALTERFESLPPVHLRIAIDGAPPGWLRFEDSHTAAHGASTSADTRADELLLLYFTSGTTARPKLVAHTHESYPIGHLSTMYWLGVRPGDVHLNLSSPGWAKHAWSCFFAPWSAEATVFVYHYDRFNPQVLLERLVAGNVSTFCAPPTVWRFLIQENLQEWRVPLREAVSAGEPLNPEVIERIRSAWALTVRDGFGQTETTAQVGNPPGQPIKPGSMGRPLPGYSVELMGLDGRPAAEGEICLDLKAQPLGLMRGYLDDPDRTAEVMRDGFYHTGDIASRDDKGYLTYVGRTDDVFKCSDYLISPFELESVLIEHDAVAEAAVVPTPDPLRLSVPKAYVVLAGGHPPSAETAREILLHVRERVSPYKRIRCIEFATLPKTISGKIRRIELRRIEEQRGSKRIPREHEYWEDVRG